MSLSLIDDGDDIFNHMLYSGSIRTLSLISGMVITDWLQSVWELLFILSTCIKLENRSCSVMELRFYTKKSLKLIIKHQPQ